ncbi:MAG: hypothetical protein KF729_16735 [Sandaracinaceae bacterium]|nr:hypothetical protein [Sandaracinaceae bacterium]
MTPVAKVTLRRTSALVLLTALCAPSGAQAQTMNIAVSRLRIESQDQIAFPETPCPSTFTVDGRALTRDWCPDEDAWRRVMTQFGASLIPPILTQAGTRGVRGIYVGFETWLTGIDNGQEYWHRAVEGDGGSADHSRSRFVDGVLGWGRLNVRKGLPFGFELGTNIGYLANTTYWTLGLEVRWALWEGFRDGVGWIPDFAVRAAVQTLLGDGEFNVTVPSVDLILSQPIVVGNSVEITPSVFAQIAWLFADSELVDLDPDTSAFDTCMPEAETPAAGSPPYCRGEGMQLNHNVVMPSIRSTRVRVGGGLQLRYEWFTLMGSFLADVARPADLDGNLPGDLPAQWQVNIGTGLTF